MNTIIRTLSLLALGSGLMSQSAEASTRTYDVGANSTKAITLNFNGANSIDLDIAGDGDTDVDFRVVNAWGETLFEDVDDTDFTWTNLQRQGGGPYTLYLINRGDVYNRVRVSVD